VKAAIKERNFFPPGYQHKSKLRIKCSFLWKNSVTLFATFVGKATNILVPFDFVEFDISRDVARYFLNFEQPRTEYSQSQTSLFPEIYKIKIRGEKQRYMWNKTWT